MLKTIYDSIKENAKLELFMSLILIVAVTAIACNMNKITKDNHDVEKQSKEGSEGILFGKSVVIDPGHGGRDPGKVAVNGAEEKDINLDISLKLRDVLVSAGCKVTITREDDNVLPNVEKYSKIADMNRRCQIINDMYAKNNSCIMVSIHQNSFTKDTVSGAQCFYYEDSERSRELAEAVQNNLNINVNINNEKIIKSNNSYYMLLNSKCPGIIVECGFLSNNLEAEKLVTEEYQKQIAETIKEGIVEFFNKN